MSSNDQDKGGARSAIVDRLLETMKQGELPWRKPWASVEKGDAVPSILPANAITGREYTGINRLMLMMSSPDLSDQRWLTFNQAKDAGGSVRKGEKGVPCERWEEQPFWRRTDLEILHGGVHPVKVKGVSDGMAETTTRGTVPTESLKIAYREREYSWDSAERYLNRKYAMAFTVFHVSQCDDLDPAKLKGVAPREVAPTAEVVRDVIEGMQATGLRIKEAEQDRAYYNPAVDQIMMPTRGQFAAEYDHQATLLHEVAHATGHAGRLGRDLSHPFGTEGYAREELVAELTSVFLGAETGVVMHQDAHENHAAYLQSWIKAIEKDPAVLRSAARDAGMAADYVMERVAEIRQERSAERGQGQEQEAQAMVDREEAAQLDRREEPVPLKDLEGVGPEVAERKDPAIERLQETDLALAGFEEEPEVEAVVERAVPRAGKARQDPGLER